MMKKRMVATHKQAHVTEKSLAMNDQLALYFFTLSDNQFADPKAQEYLRLQKKIELVKIQLRAIEIDVAIAPIPSHAPSPTTRLLSPNY